MIELSPQDAEKILKQMDEDVGILVLVQGTLADGSAHYAYAAVPPSRYMAFKEAEAAGNYDLATFGKILAHGAGKTPPPEVEKRMAEEYGANHRFEEDMTAWAEDLQRQLKPGHDG
jgi:hypothetical protein